MRKGLFVGVVALVVAAWAPSGGGQARTSVVYGYGHADARISQLPLRGFTGGPITTTTTGETVQVFVDDDYLAADPTTQQRFADMLASLVHGEEIADVTVYVAALDTISRVCGREAGACYDARSQTIVTIGDDSLAIPAFSILAHEYGHHVALNRDNEPWDAIDYGTKRWASIVNVCRNAENGTFSPGDQQDDYEVNPGEGFAEAYRVLNERRLGTVESAWRIVSRLFYPTELALQRVEQDVVEPWVRPAPSVIRGRFAPSAPVGRTISVATQNDGTISVTLKAALNTRLELRLRAPNGRVLASDVSDARTKTVAYDVCGERSVKIGIRRVSARAGAYELRVSKP